jgi:hypothetical protein
MMSVDYLIQAIVDDLGGYQVLLDEITVVEGAKVQSSFVVKTFVERPI